MVSTKKITEKLKLLCNEKYIEFIDDDLALYNNDYDMMKCHNIARKAICILLYIWSIEGIVSPSKEICCSDYISFEKNAIQYLYLDDEMYSGIALSILQSYGWIRSKRWNFNPYFAKDGEVLNIIQSLHVQAQEALFECCNEFFETDHTVNTLENEDFYYISSLHVVEYSNPKLDLIYSIWDEKSKKDVDEQMRADFSDICSSADIFLSPFAYLPIYQDKIIDNENGEKIHRYICIFPEMVDTYGYNYAIDINRFFTPSIFYIVAKLDSQMDNFIRKWLFY